MDNNFLSIIIVTLNRKDEIIKCVETILIQDFKNYEIIIIDNNSSDDTSKIIKEKFPDVRLYKTYKNMGTSYTRNAAINFSNGENILFLDSDTYLKDNKTLSDLVKKLKGEIHALGGESIINENNKLISKKKLKLYPNGMIKGYIRNDKNFEKVEVLATCNLLTKKKYIKDVGGFDHYFFFYLEDLDLTYRMHKKGFNLYLLDECKIIHYFSPNTRFTNYFQSNRNRIYFLVKNFNIKNTLILPLNDLFYFLNFDSIRRIYNTLYENRKIENYRIKNVKRKLSFQNIFYTIKKIFLILFSLLISYCYIPYYLITRNKIKQKKNFLSLVDKNDFTEIK